MAVEGLLVDRIGALSIQQIGVLEASSIDDRPCTSFHVGHLRPSRLCACFSRGGLEQVGLDPMCSRPGGEVREDVSVGQERRDEPVVGPHLLGLANDHLQQRCIEIVVEHEGVDADERLALSEPVDPSVSLLQPVWVPRQLVVDDLRTGVLQVQSLTDAVSRNQHCRGRPLELSEPRIEVIDSVEVCRLDVPASSKPIWTTFKKKDAILFERRNNSTRAVPTAEVDQFIIQ